MDKEPSKIIKVIKGKDHAPAPLGEEITVESMERGGVIKGDIYAASEKAREIIQKAQQEAEEIVRRAKEAMDKERQDGFQAGYQEGLAQVTELLVRARADYDQSLRNSQQDMLNLAFRIAEKIIGKKVEMDQQVILDIVKQALQTVRQSKQVTIRVHPDDARLMRENEEVMMETLGHGRIIDIVDDAKIARGGCIIESEFGTVEAQLQTQLDRLKKVLSERKV
jgi:type III secretion protein L